MQESIKSTMNYELFDLHEFNREVKTTERLEKSMMKHGWISAYPMHVVKGYNGRLKIKGGHHRFTAARKLGIPVKYVVCDDDASIVETEEPTIPWVLQHYFDNYLRAGNPHYAQVKRYVEDTGVPLSMAVSLCAGESAGSANHGNKIKAGTYKVGGLRHALDVKAIILGLKKIGFPYASQALFVQAISKVLRVPDFDITHFLKRATVNIGMMQRQSTGAAYLDMIEAVYNHGSKRARLPLAFLADQASRERQKVWRKKQ